ncbi:MAG: endopeptidase La [Acidobacteriota bacterium]
MASRWGDSRNGSRGNETPRELPLIPLLSTVVFPGMIVNLQVARARNLRLVEDIDVDDQIGLILQKNLTISEPQPEHLSRIGVASRVINKVNVPGNSVQLILQGLRRFEIEDWVTLDPYLTAKVRDAEADKIAGLAANVLINNAVALFEELASVEPGISREAVSLVKMNMDGPGQLADQVATRLMLRLEDKKQILETLDPEERLRRIVGILKREIQVKKVGADIQKQTQDEIGRAQREYILRQQLKTIKKELGENQKKASGEGKDLRTRIETVGLPPEVSREALAELGRLEAMSPASAEYGVLRSYLETLVDLPWDQESEDTIELADAQTILDDDHFGLDKVKERIVEFLAVRKANPDLRGPILCLAGPPGTGKTSLGKAIARSTARQFVRVSVGGMRDEAEIRGHRRTYVGAMPGKVMQALRRCGTKNPVFVIDEIDKIGADYRGDPASALLEVLDPEQNHGFRDLYLDAPFDLSHVLFVATANRIDTIPAALRDRLEVIELSGYSEEEKLAIGRRYLLPKQMKEAALDEGSVSFDESALTAILREHTRDAGVRSFERHLAAICRKLAKARALDEPAPARITPAEVTRYLGAPRFCPEMAGRVDEVGVATGLAWTPNGGEILFIETSRVRGDGKLILTGSLGDVMKESARAGLSYLKAHCRDLGIPDDLIEQTDLHLHVPAGAIPKDGPSAGVAGVVAMASVLSGRPVRHDVAMTGEVTLRGRVLPVGGVREKILAARRAGVSTVVLPLWNRKDLVDVPAEIRAELRFLFVENVQDAVDILLRPETSGGVFVDRNPHHHAAPAAVTPEVEPPAKELPQPAADH